MQFQQNICFDILNPFYAVCMYSFNLFYHRNSAVVTCQFTDNAVNMPIAKHVYLGMQINHGWTLKSLKIASDANCGYSV